jgi:hypothetical protein
MGNQNAEIVAAISALAHRVGDRSFPILAECVGKLAALVSEPSASRQNQTTPASKPKSGKKNQKQRGVIIPAELRARMQEQVKRDGTITNFARRVGMTRPQMTTYLREGAKVLPDTLAKIEAAIVLDRVDEDPYSRIAADADGSTVTSF